MRMGCPLLTKDAGFELRLTSTRRCRESMKIREIEGIRFTKNSIVQTVLSP
jgi:hypothetical protein